MEATEREENVRAKVEEVQAAVHKWLTSIAPAGSKRQRTEALKLRARLHELQDDELEHYILGIMDKFGALIIEA